ncbi:MAG: bifunctional diaminohydroxyphosphoribosylaminopyrimidine deaminase/5-amino-6-(5-phosphoribosylamino)uracil reductase RibD [Phycisphaeraceae bacterium]|nr:bifunctional diaminohydroxyphosphoribosylaminopyrimidine deaminase/5-amino-6-(5-phosphoribosylamino)uracil reductase RibD [Phycisphaerales bacterium]MCB9842884.1 bifunctional diaminohydroxyphosphoribosylaminopyrimidine deaminase/5-amino-6-(5-phosphoribosylamino)uracil reductase RibD [Phycisphaeraceae bacterium]
MSDALNKRMLDLAARCAARGAGRVEPNPMVGCVIGSDAGEVCGVGHHRQFGGAHAEVEALRNVTANGRDARGGTAWVTLEPCAHFGKTPPCADALIAAGIRRVVIARRDPHGVSAGGIEKLLAAGVAVEVTGVSAAAVAVSEAFVRGIERGRPFVTVKWAQTVDGRIATRTGDSKWISCERSRRRVHRMRAVSDVVMTGIGTVLADDPLLTARGVPVRKVAKRVVIDSGLRLPLDSALVRSVDRGPVWVVSVNEMAESPEADALEERGVEMLFVPAKEGRVDLRAAVEFFGALSQLEDMSARDDATHVMVEAGPGLAGALMREGLVDRCVVFVAPMMVGDDAAPGAMALGASGMIGDAQQLALIDQRRCGADVMLTYSVTGSR